MKTQLPTIKELVTDTRVRFMYYRKGELWYEVTRKAQMYHGWLTLFTFPVPIDDTGDATFLAEDKALLFMRYIRKHLAAVKQEMESV